MNEKQRRRMKWVGIVLGGFFALCLLGALLIPLFFNVDKYRPDIINAANEKLNGQLELGKLSLSLWGQVRINVDGLAITDSGGRKVLAAKDVYFHIPFWSVLIASPRITFNVNKPEVHVFTDKKGEMNVTKLVKSAPEAKPQEEAPKADAQLPGIVASAKLGIELRDATLSYEDRANKMKTKVNNLNFIAKDLSLGSSSEMELWADLDTKMGKTLSIKGPAKLLATATPTLENDKFKEAKVKFKIDLNELVIDMPDTFSKTKGVEAWASGELIVGPNTAGCENFEIRFHNASIKGSGRVDGLTKPPMTVNFSMEAPGIEIAPWKKLVAALKPYDVNGAVSLKARASGPVKKPNYFADIQLKNATFAGANLIAKPKMSAALVVKTNQVEKMAFSLSAPSNDLRISGNLKSFSAPVLNLSVLSKGMDLDKLLKFPQKAKAGGSAKGKAAASVDHSKVNYDAMLDPLRKNAILRKARGNVNVNMAYLKAMDVKMSGIKSTMTMRRLNFALKKFAMKVFNGNIATSGNVNIAPKTPKYALQADVKGLDLGQAVKSQFAPFKNTLVGNGYFKMKLTGASFNPKAAKAALAANGNMEIKYAKFNTIDIGKVATGAINKTMTDIANKVPSLRGKTLKTPKNVQSEFESVTSPFTIGGGKFRAPNFFAKSLPNKGFDIRGNTEVNLLNDQLRADWELSDTYNLLKARDLSVNIAGTNVPQVLAKDGVVRLPLRVGGTVIEPKVDYGRVPESIASVALNNIKKAGEQRIKREAEKAVKKEANKLLKQGLKGLFGN